jgi:hypothetical protein
MARAMKRTDVDRALQKNGCSIKSDTGSHTKWVCPYPCGAHSANIPRHREISAGVVADTIKRMACLPEGWLQ